MDQLTAHLDRAWDLVTRGDLAGASVSAEKSLELDQQSPEAHNLMGFIRAQEGDAEAALQHYQQAIDEDDTYVEAMLNAAELLIHPFHDFEGARLLIDDALELCEAPEETADAVLLKADCYLHQGDNESAKRALRQLPEGLPDNPALKLRVGRLLFEVGSADEAATLLRAATEADPSNAEAHYSLGLALEALGDTRGAAIAFLQTRDLDRQLPPPPWALPTDQFEKRLQSTIHRLPKPVAQRLENALVVVADLPGAEVVADGVDPRVPLLLDSIQEVDGIPRVGRVFVYQRNIERLAAGLLEIEEEIYTNLEHELEAAFENPPTEDA